jgi:nitric oxide reductase subunit B
MAFRHATAAPEAPTPAPASDPLLHARSTPSQRAIVKYFWTVSALALLQIVVGVITAHYGVEGGGFFGLHIDDILPYTVTRTWHTQLGIFWIATAWLAAGLYIAPAVGAEPKGQRLGVNVLFGALVVVVFGSMAGEWLSVKQMLPGELWYWFGHSGYEYIDLGRFFQIALMIDRVSRPVWKPIDRYVGFFIVTIVIDPELVRSMRLGPVLVVHGRIGK